MAFAIPLALAAGGAATAATASAGTLATIGTIASIAGAGIGAFGAMQSANAASASAKYNAQVAENNAIIAKQNATWAAQSGEQHAEMSEAKTRATVGAIMANQAASGVDVASGSSLDVRSSARSLGELDAINIRAEAARTAYGYDVQSSNDKAQSQLDTFEAKNDMTAGYLGAGSSILGGVGSAANSYALYSKGIGTP